MFSEYQVSDLSCLCLIYDYRNDTWKTLWNQASGSIGVTPVEDILEFLSISGKLFSQNTRLNKMRAMGSVILTNISTYV